MYGTIYDAFNSLLASVTGEAYDKDLRSEQLPGSVVTGATVLTVCHIPNSNLWSFIYTCRLAEIKPVEKI